MAAEVTAWQPSEVSLNTLPSCRLIAMQIPRAVVIRSIAIWNISIAWNGIKLQKTLRRCDNGVLPGLSSYENGFHWSAVRSMPPLFSLTARRHMCLINSWVSKRYFPLQMLQGPPGMEQASGKHINLRSCSSDPLDLQTALKH